MDMNLVATTRRIRNCESEVPAQLVLEYTIMGAVEAEREQLRSLIADDAYACTFQSMAQYRAALLKALAGHPIAG
jgi:hypothetical protein